MSETIRTHPAATTASILFIVLGVTAGVSVAILIPLWSASNPFLNAQLAYALPTLIALVLILVHAIRWGWRGLLTPVVMTMLGFLIFFSAAPLLNPCNSDTAMGIYSSPERFLPLVALDMIGLMAFLLGSWMAPTPRPSFRWVRFVTFEVAPGRLWRWCVRVTLVAGALLAVVSILNGFSPLDYFSRSRYGGAGIAIRHPLSNYLYQVVRLLPVAVTVLAAALLSISRSRWRRLFAFVSVGFFSLFVLATGVRWQFSYVAGGAALVWFGLNVGALSGRNLRLPRRWRMRFFAIVATLAFVTANIIVMRGAGGLANYFSRGPRLANLQNFVDSGLDQNVPLEQVLEAVPRRRPYVGGLSYLSTFVLLVPRAVWPGKPETAYGYMRDVTTIDRYRANPNASWSNIGELYMNFGFVGVVIGMCVTGFLLRAWHKLYLACQQSVPVTILYYMSLPAIAFAVRGDFQVAAGGILYPMLVVILALRASRRRAGRAS